MAKQVKRQTANGMKAGDTVRNVVTGHVGTIIGWSYATPESGLAIVRIDGCRHDPYFPLADLVPASK